jgi:hypothetical protein
VGLFDRLFGKGKAAPAATAEPEPEPEPPPDAVVVLREGMRVPEREYVLEVAAPAFDGKPPDGLPHLGLSQPRWFKPGDFTQTGVADVVAAVGEKLGVPGARWRYSETTGPDGARVMLVELRRAGE